MGIKCSLLGHDFGEPTVERDREEQGSEVVTTIREIETCSSCGETRVVSENKEVTSLETPEDVGGTPDRESAPASVGDGPADETSTGGDGEDATTTPEDAGIVDAESDADGDDRGTATGTGTGAGPEGTMAGTADPETEDAEILDDSSDRDPGEWPQEDDDEESFDQFEYADPETDQPDEEDAELIDVDDAGTQTNSWPSEDEGGADPTSPGAITVPEGTFVCDACGFSTPVESSSLREGDFCPECHGETLVQVPEDERRNE